MSEKKLWEYIKNGMGNIWDAQRHEDKHSTGIPDISYGTNVNGWMELKYYGKDPGQKPIRIRHFTADQKNWLKKRGQKGGYCFILVQVYKSYYLFNWRNAGTVDGGTLSDYNKFCIRSWHDNINWLEFYKAISAVDDNIQCMLP